VALARVAGVEVGSVGMRSAEVTFDRVQRDAGEIAGAVDRIGFVARVERCERWRLL
jgi:hypothetical protein